MKILYLVPAYNEEKTIGGVLEKIKEHNSHPDADILVVDDGSTDDTTEKAREAGVKLVQHPVNLGGGAAYRTGYKYAVRKGYDVVLSIDADGQHDPKYMDDVLEPVLDGDADLCIGSRFRGERGYDMPFVRWIGNKTFSFITSVLSGQDITDTTSGFRAVRRKLFKHYTYLYPDSIYAIEATIWSGRRGFKIEEVPVIMSEREAGQSYLDPIRLIKYPFKMIYAIIRAL